MPKDGTQSASSSEIVRSWGVILNEVIAGQRRPVTRYGQTIGYLLPLTAMPEAIHATDIDAADFIRDWGETRAQIEAGAVLRILRHGTPVAYFAPPEFVE